VQNFICQNGNFELNSLRHAQPVRQTNACGRIGDDTSVNCAAGFSGSRTLRPQDISAPRHFGTNFKPNHRWICVLSELSLVQSVPTFCRSDAEVSRTTFLAQKCLETVLKCLMRVRSVLVPKCLVAEVSGNRFSTDWSRRTK